MIQELCTAQQSRRGASRRRWRDVLGLTYTDQIVTETVGAGSRYGVKPDLLQRQIVQESGGDQTQPATRARQGCRSLSPKPHDAMVSMFARFRRRSMVRRVTCAICCSAITVMRDWRSPAIIGAKEMSTAGCGRALTRDGCRRKPETMCKRSALSQSARGHLKAAGGRWQELPAGTRGATQPPADKPTPKARQQGQRARSQLDKAGNEVVDRNGGVPAPPSAAPSAPAATRVGNVGALTPEALTPRSAEGTTPNSGSLGALTPEALTRSAEGTTPNERVTLSALTPEALTFRRARRPMSGSHRTSNHSRRLRARAFRRRRVVIAARRNSNGRRSPSSKRNRRHSRWCRPSHCRAGSGPSNGSRRLKRWMQRRAGKGLLRSRRGYWNKRPSGFAILMDR